KGSPANGIYDLQFTLYNATTNGTAVTGPISNAPTMVSNDLFSMTLDFGTAAWDGAPRWLDLSVRTNGNAGTYAALAPRQPVTSVPYAIRAANFSGPVAASQITGTLAASNIGAATIT